MYSEGMSRRWRHCPFWKVWIDMLLSDHNLDHGTCCNIEVRVLCIIIVWTVKHCIDEHISDINTNAYKCLVYALKPFVFQSINLVILMLCSFFTALPLLNSVDWHVTLNIFLLATWIMEPAVTLRWEFFAYCVNCQALHRWAYKWHKYISTQVT